jgi:hypothetical protein
MDDTGKLVWRIFGRFLGGEEQLETKPHGPE